MGWIFFFLVMVFIIRLVLRLAIVFGWELFLRVWSILFFWWNSWEIFSFMCFSFMVVWVIRRLYFCLIMVFGKFLVNSFFNFFLMVVLMLLLVCCLVCFWNCFFRFVLSFVMVLNLFIFLVKLLFNLGSFWNLIFLSLILNNIFFFVIVFKG